MSSGNYSLEAQARVTACGERCGAAAFPLSRGADRRRSDFRVLEELGIELVPLEEFVELRAIAFGEAGSLGHVAVRNTQYLRKVLALEFSTRVFE